MPIIETVPPFRHPDVITAVVAGALACLLVTLPATRAAAQAPTEAQLEAAIAAGIREKRTVSLRLGAEQGGAMTFVCNGADRTSVCGYTIELQGPIGRVQSAASDAAKQYRPFTLAAVSDSLRAPVLIIRATPAPPRLDRSREYRAAAATHIVLIPLVGREARESAAVQPSVASTFPVIWSNLAGGERSGQGVVATFPLALVPTSDFYVVVVTEGQEARYQIQAKHRSGIR